MSEPMPALWLHGAERRYGRGETTIEVLSGADLVLWPGQSVALILSIAATIYPSWRAARLDPVEALRYE